LLPSRGEEKVRKRRRSGNFVHLDLKTVSEAGRSTSRSAVKQGTSVQEHEHTTLPARPRCYESERDLKAQEEGNGREDPAARERARRLTRPRSRRGAAPPARPCRREQRGARSDEAAAVPGPAAAVVQPPVAAAAVVGAPRALPPPRPRVRPPPRRPPRLPRPRRDAVQLRRVIRIRDHLLPSPPSGNHVAFFAFRGTVSSSGRLTTSMPILVSSHCTC